MIICSGSTTRCDANKRSPLGPPCFHTGDGERHLRKGERPQCQRCCLLQRTLPLWRCAATRGPGQHQIQVGHVQHRVRLFLHTSWTDGALSNTPRTSYDCFEIFAGSSVYNDGDGGYENVSLSPNHSCHEHDTDCFKDCLLWSLSRCQRWL